MKTYLCRAWGVVLLILYVIPIYLDLYPASDVYLGGYGALGILALTSLVLALLVSIGYGMKCIHKLTVYRCIGWGCNKNNPALQWPNEETKKDYEHIYRDTLNNVPNKGFTSYLPWSEYSYALDKLNRKYFP